MDMKTNNKTSDWMKSLLHQQEQRHQREMKEAVREVYTNVKNIIKFCRPKWGRTDDGELGWIMSEDCLGTRGEGKVLALKKVLEGIKQLQVYQNILEESNDISDQISQSIKEIKP